MDRAIRGQTGSLSPLRTMTRAEIAGTTNYEIINVKEMWEANARGQNKGFAYI